MNAALLEWKRNSGRIYFQCIYYSGLILSERMKKCNSFETSLHNESKREKRMDNFSGIPKLHIQPRSRDAELESGVGRNLAKPWGSGNDIAQNP